MLARLAHLVHRRRGRVVAVWIVLTVFGVFATTRVSSRWLESFSIPGYSAYETNQKALKTFGYRRCVDRRGRGRRRLRGFGTTGR